MEERAAGSAGEQEILHCGSARMQQCSCNLLVIFIYREFFTIIKTTTEGVLVWISTNNLTNHVKTELLWILITHKIDSTFLVSLDILKLITDKLSKLATH